MQIVIRKTHKVLKVKVLYQKGKTIKHSINNYGLFNSMSFKAQNGSCSFPIPRSHGTKELKDQINLSE